MGYADGYYYGQGRIICDTSTFSVGDTIRVRSMTDSSKVWNQQVATVGTALVFTVPCYDYYKICTVQTINDTPTEIGGVYKTVDYGQTIYLNMLNKSTLVGIQSILNAHQEADVINIGDEVDISISGSPWTMQVAGINLYDSHEVIFVSKKIWALTAITGTSTDQGYWNYSPAYLSQKNDDFYNAMSSEEQSLLKAITKSARKPYTAAWSNFSAKVYPISCYEAFGTVNGTPSIAQHQFPLFVTQSSRVKSYDNANYSWWTCDGDPAGGPFFTAIDNTGASQYLNRSTANVGAVPCFTLRADS